VSTRSLPESNFVADLWNYRQFLALVEFESKKKRMAGKAAAHYMDQFVQRLDEGEQELKKKLQDLRTAA